MAKNNFFGHRRNTVKLHTNIPRIVRAKPSDIDPRSKSVNQSKSPVTRKHLEAKINEFMIEDQILDDQINNAKHREEQEILRKKKELRDKRIQAYKLKLLEKA